MKLLLGAQLTNPIHTTGPLKILTGYGQQIEEEEDGAGADREETLHAAKGLCRFETDLAVLGHWFQEAT